MKQTNLSRRQQYIFNLSAFETLRNPKRKCHFVLQANDIEKHYTKSTAMATVICKFQYTKLMIYERHRTGSKG
jgi:hypothetical protein